MSKRKFSVKSPLQYWVDELIFFRRDFLFMTPAAADMVAQYIRDLDHERKGLWRTRRIMTTVNEGRNDHWFNVTAEQPNKHGYQQSATAEGEIFQDDDGMTIVQGNIIMGNWGTWGVFFGFGLFLIFLASSSFDDLPSRAIIFGVYLVMLLYIWVQMYNDRNHLEKIIRNAVDYTADVYAGEDYASPQAQADIKAKRANHS